MSFPNIVFSLTESAPEWARVILRVHTHAITPSVYQTLIWLLILQSGRTSVWTVAFLSWPGTLLHELMHVLVGWLLGAKPVAINLLPHHVGDRWILGSIAFARINIFNAAPTALAPLLMLPIAWWLFQHWMVPVFVAGHYAEWALAGYLVGCCVFGGLPSWIDIKLGTPSALMWTVLGSALWFAASLT